MYLGAYSIKIVKSYMNDSVVDKQKINIKIFFPPLVYLIDSSIDIIRFKNYWNISKYLEKYQILFSNYDDVLMLISNIKFVINQDKSMLKIKIF